MKGVPGYSVLMKRSKCKTCLRPSSELVHSECGEFALFRRWTLSGFALWAIQRVRNPRKIGPEYRPRKKRNPLGSA